MACSSCAERARQRALAAQQVAQASRATVTSATTYQGVKNLATAGYTAGCMQKYDELVQLDTKIIQLWKIYRRTEIGFEYAELQKGIRACINALPNKCPDEDWLKKTEEIINGDWAKHFGDPTITQKDEHPEPNTDQA